MLPAEMYAPVYKCVGDYLVDVCRILGGVAPRGGSLREITAKARNYEQREIIQNGGWQDEAVNKSQGYNEATGTTVPLSFLVNSEFSDEWKL
jgi:hypothetical protein